MKQYDLIVIGGAALPDLLPLSPPIKTEFPIF